MQQSASKLPETGFLRLAQIVGRPGGKRTGPITGLLPVSRSTFLLGVRQGRYPKPVKLGPRITAWRVEDIRDVIAKASDLPPSSTHSPGQVG